MYELENDALDLAGEKAGLAAERLLAKAKELERKAEEYLAIANLRKASS